MRFKQATMALAAVLSTACSADRLNITNPNVPTVEGASGDAQALQLFATGLLRQYRNGRGGFIISTGIFGRELLNYTPQEGRNTSGFLIGLPGANRLDPAGFANGNWATQYGNLRDVFNFKNTISAAGALSTAEKSAALGFARTIEAAELLEVIATRDTLGLVVEIRQNASDIAPFVSRDSGYRYILNTLDQGFAELGQGGTAFPFALNTGFTGFTTPADFARFNRAIAARAASYYATAGGGTTAWQRTLTALNASFINVAATTRAQLDAGVYFPYSGSTGDATNPLNSTTNTDLYVHPSTLTDAPRKADGSLDNRYAAKIGTRAARGPGGSVAGIQSTLGLNQYPTTSTSIPVIRNEELILIRAEALLGTGDKAGAIQMINVIRVNSGGLAPTTLTASSSDTAILDEILLQKRYSLFAEGTRWIDLRRYGRLNTLPLDAASHFVARVQPIPQAECLVRVGQQTPLAGPGCP